MPSRLEAARRYLALARAVARARRAAWDPFKLTWILTEACSLRCHTCHLWATDPAAGPSLAEVRAVVAANRQLTWVNLSGGDFVERSDAPALMTAIVDGLPDLALLDFPTAGQDCQATLDALTPALDSDVPRIYVTVSLDGPDAVHDRVRGQAGAAVRARRTFERLSALRRPGLTVVAGMTLSSRNLPPAPPADASALQDLLPDGVAPADLHLNLAHHSAHYYRNREDVTPPVDSALALIDQALAGRRLRTPLDLVERRYWHIARRFLTSGDVGGRCAALRGSVYLAADLRVYPCSIFDRPLGDLRQVDWSLRRLAELPQGPGALGDVEARACPGCWSPCEAFPTLLVGLGRPL